MIVCPCPNTELSYRNLGQVGIAGETCWMEWYPFQELDYSH